MTLELLQHSADLIGTSRPTSLQGNENTISASQKVLNVVGGLQVLAQKMSERGIDSTSDLFKAWDELNEEREEGEEREEAGR